jgi:O-antigen/teichoic acid export membrane protein
MNSRDEAFGAVARLDLRQRLDLKLLTRNHRSLVGSLAAGGASQLALVIGGVLSARMLGANDRGYFALILLVPHILAQLGTLGLPLAITYFIASRPRAARRIVRSSATTAAVQVVVCASLQVLILYFLLRGDPNRVKIAAVVSLGLTPGLFALQYGPAILQGKRHFKPFNILRVMPVVLYSLGVLIIYILGYRTLIAITVVQLLAVGIAGTAVMFVALKRLQGEGADLAENSDASEENSFPASIPEAPPRKELTWFGIKGLLGSMSAVETLRIDQAVIGLFLSPIALGLYVVGISVTNLPRFLTQSVGMVAYPAVASTDEALMRSRLVWRYFWIATAVAVAVVVPLEISASTLIPLFFGHDFEASVPVAQIMLAGTVAVGARRVLADGVRGAGHPALGTVAELTAWVVLGPMLALFVPRLGVKGVALALATSWAVSLVFLAAAVVWVSGSRAMARATAHRAGQLEEVA